MDKYINIIDNLLTLESEYEWFDVKNNWFSKNEIGEYISAISNAATLCGKEEGYLVWGIDDKIFEVVGTTVNFNIDIMVSHTSII